MRTPLIATLAAALSIILTACSVSDVERPPGENEPDGSATDATTVGSDTGVATPDTGTGNPDAGGDTALSDDAGSEAGPPKDDGAVDATLTEAGSDSAFDATAADASDGSSPSDSQVEAAADAADGAVFDAPADGLGPIADAVADSPSMDAPPDGPIADAAPDASDASPPSCLGGARDCIANDTPRLCTNGNWVAQPACSSSTPVCTAGLCVCTEGARDCVGATPRICSSQVWTPQAACSGATPVCSGAGQCGCANGTQQCGDTMTPQLCVNNTWASQPACSSSTPACYGTGQCGCSNGATSCANATTPQLCVSNAWVVQPSCSSSASTCSSGACVPPSCNGLPNTCGPLGNESCCATGLTIPGGTFNRSNDPAYPATVSSFVLDRFEITVGRFRKFVAGYPGNMPANGSGRNPNNPSDPGWNVAWNTNGSLSSTQAGLIAGLLCPIQPAYATWTGGNENRPIACTTWYEAYAFCIWDGGRLPTEAEWNYAAAGGNEQRKYPWGTAEPGANASLSNWGCYYNGNGTCTGVTDVAPVGSASPAGDGRWHHADLAGNLGERVRDWWVGDAYVSGPCVDCADARESTFHVIRGGGYDNNSSTGYLLSSYRGGKYPWERLQAYGARCARNP